MFSIRPIPWFGMLDFANFLHEVYFRCFSFKIFFFWLLSQIITWSNQNFQVSVYFVNCFFSCSIELLSRYIWIYTLSLLISRLYQNIYRDNIHNRTGNSTLHLVLFSFSFPIRIRFCVGSGKTILWLGLLLANTWSI